MDSTKLPERLYELVSEITARPLDPANEGDLPLRDLGLSSLRMIQLITDLEARFSIRVGDDDVDEENFGTLSGLVRFVTARTKS